MRVASRIKMSKTSVRWAFNWLEWDPSETEFTKAISCVQIEEKERLGRFVFRKDARASLAGRLLMRKFINEYAGIPYDEIRFTREENGRPVFKNGLKPISFNVSHQGSYTVLAGEVGDIFLGVDVMKLEYNGGKELEEFFRIMNRNFTPMEWKAIKGDESTSEKDKTSMFCRHWSLKESYVKAIGVGIAANLSEISFKVNSPLKIGELIVDTELHLAGVKQNWLFEESLLDSNHCVAVALQENNSAPETRGVMFEDVSFERLMRNSVSYNPLDFEYSKKYFAKSEKP